MGVLKRIFVDEPLRQRGFRLDREREEKSRKAAQEFMRRIREGRAPGADP